LKIGGDILSSSKAGTFMFFSSVEISLSPSFGNVSFIFDPEDVFATPNLIFF
jgi:hypothetical protein